MLPPDFPRRTAAFAVGGIVLRRQLRSALGDVGIVEQCRDESIRACAGDVLTSIHSEQFAGQAGKKGTDPAGANPCRSTRGPPLSDRCGTSPRGPVSGTSPGSFAASSAGIAAPGSGCADTEPGPVGGG